MVDKKKHSRETCDRKIYLIISFLAFLCIIFSTVIYLQKLTDNQAINNVCSVLGSQSQCETVQQSKYGSILGIDNPVFGLVGFTALMILSWMFYRTEDRIARKLMFLGIFIAGFLALWFLYLQAFVLGAYCIFCVIIDIISVLLMGLVVYLMIKKI